MKLLKPLVSKISLSTLLFILPMSAALAGPGAINYSIASGIPTLSGTMLMVLSLLLFVVAFKISRQKNSSGSNLFITLIGVAALAIGGGGIKLIADVQAGGSIPLALNKSTTTGELPLVAGFNQFQNPNAEIVTITGITPPAGTTCSPIMFGRPATAAAEPVPTCSVSLTIPNMNQCQLACFSINPPPAEL